MKVSTRPSTGVSRSSKEASHRRFDIAGVLVCALAILMVIALATKDAGILGRAAGDTLLTFFGKGSWPAPVLLGLIGVVLFKGKVPVITSVAYGSALVFLSLLGFLAQPYRNDFFDLRAVAEGGGYVGAAVAWLFQTLFGTGKAVALGALGLIGVVLWVNVPVREMVAQARTVALKAKEQAKAKVAAAAAKAEVRAKSCVPPASTAPTDPRAYRSLPKDEIVEPEQLQPTVEAAPRPKSTRAAKSATPELDLNLESGEPKEGYTLPPTHVLAEALMQPRRSHAEMQRNIETLEGTLEQFGIEAQVVEVAAGPTVTRYEIVLGPGVRVNRITALADNIAMDLAASQVRVEAPIPGKAAIGVEVPNGAPSTVTLRELCEDTFFRSHPSRLLIALGKDVSGANRYADLSRMPHLLIGGATNSGKSIALASLITSLLMRNTPKDCRLVMIDPKRVELTLFDGIPHLMCPVVKDVKEAPGVLRAVWREMDRRYDLLSEMGVRNIEGYNTRASFADKLPYIVVTVDELADLMIQAQAEVETVIVRLAQLARAVGIHLVLATQRPSVDVITGLIKANIPSRIAFSVASHIDSRTILDQKGAEALIGKGDMLYSPIDANKPIRVQGCYVSEREIEAICKHWRDQEPPIYVLKPIDEMPLSGRESGASAEMEDDPLWEEAVRWVVDRGQASTSMMQRKFSIGFQRASRLLDLMEERGIVGPRDGPRPREILVNPMDVVAMFGTGHRYDIGPTLDDDALGDPSEKDD